MRQLVTSFRIGTPKHVLAHRYAISLSTAKRLLRTEDIGRATL
jgi:ribosomal protein S25